MEKTFKLDFSKEKIKKSNFLITEARQDLGLAIVDLIRTIGKLGDSEADDVIDNVFGELIKQSGKDLESIKQLG